ncbi:MAG: MogA/MoaB family molybdenum cofactor biosynthesis protein [Thermoanaerobaculia bacterium]|nr:MogA/MoaB family molybdenum cofactor biosynthesis protein [Thermoanaerobaculia bacterium]
MSESTAAHRAAAAGQSARFAVVTVSDTRTLETDTGGAAIVTALTTAGHQLVARAIVRDEPADIDRQLRAWLAGGDLDVIVSTGGTGISSRDTTIEIVERLLSKPLPGFGELFRFLSWDQVGSAALLSRATGGLAGETLLFALPGSLAAVQLGLEKLLVPELPHLIWERRR